MEDEIENRERRSIPQEKYDLVLWTKYEKLFRKREKLRNKVLAEISVPFTIALQVKLRRSLLGTYLKYFNENQWQNEFLNNNKLTITNSIIKEFSKSKRDMFEYNNNLFDHMRNYLKNMVTETDEIDCSYLYQHATFLRLDDYHINSLDNGLRHFINLQVLVLCGNWLSDIEGSFLPRRLKCLELYANDIKSLNNLTEKAPKGLVHLGLGRNKLTNDSSLHLLVKSEKFQKLTVLDLSENDIYSLVDILTELEGLRNLESLQLQGNPCSTVTGYKDIVLQTFPLLIFLDGLEILRADRNPHEFFLDGANDAEFFFSCVKLGDLPKPPKCEKKIKQSIHIEITMPLFQEDTITEVKGDNLQVNIKDKSTKKSGKGKPRKQKAKNKKGGKVSKENVYNKEDEYNPKIKNNAFATARKQWAKVLHYPAIKLKSPENNLITYRDSYRSSVNVRVVYLKVQLPEKKKKGNKNKKKKRDKKKKNKKAEKKSKSSKGSKKKKSKTHTETTTSESSATNVKTEKLDKIDKNVEPQEKILKRITVANFNCDLLSIDWKDSFMEFFWSEDPEFANKPVEYKSYLQDLAEKEEEKKRAKLLEKMKGKETKASKKSEKKSKNSDKSKTSKSKKTKKAKSPSKSKKSKKTKSSKSSSKKSSKKSKRSKKGDKYMTCQLRFGLSRIGNIVEDDVKEDKANKKAKKSKKGKKGKNEKIDGL